MKDVQKFEKCYTPNWTTVFKITKVQKTNSITYLLEDSWGKPVARGFNECELHHVVNHDVYLVEKIRAKERMKVMWNGWDLTIYTIH